MHEYDFVMAGGGLAGLSLAHALVTGPLADRSILIVDPETKGENDRTWCYWSDRPEPFDSIAAYTWRRLRFASHDWLHDFDLGEFRYSMIRGEDFYAEVLDTLERYPRVEFERGFVTEIHNDDERALVVTDSRSVRGGWVFDSRFDPAAYERRSGPHHYLKQHFLGWTIEVDREVFDPALPTLFDFRTPQHGEMRFVYVLPFSTNRALVEYTLFSADLLADAEYVAGLESYIADVLGIHDYRVVDRESGIIPMTDEPVERREGTRTLAIGTRGGRVKASTGYAFRRTQQDTAAIVASLREHGHPFSIPRPPGRVHALDTMLLQVMYRRGELSEKTFTNLFRRNPISRLFRFLDEETSIPETLALMATVPLGAFLGAFWRTQILRKV
jgi:lycopene beta-cyclase